MIRGKSTPGKPAGIEEKHLNWGIMQERNIYCTYLKFSQHSDTRGPFLLLKRSSNGSTETFAYTHRETPAALMTDASTQPQTLSRAYTEFVHRTNFSLLLSQCSPSTSTGSMEMGGLLSQGRLGMERSLAKQSCHSSCNRRKCQTCCKFCQEPNQPSAVPQQKPGGHLLSGVPPGQGWICFSKLVQEKAQESESDCSITFLYPDELGKRMIKTKGKQREESASS